MSGPTSISGTSAAKCVTFVFAVPTGTGTADTSLPRGGYYIVPTVDTYLRLDGSVAQVPATRSPGGALPTINATLFCPAYVVTPFEMDSAGDFSVIASVAGTCVITGPLGHSQSRG
jgi:hypothetical protein